MAHLISYGWQLCLWMSNCPKVMWTNYFCHALTEYTEFALPLWLTEIITRYFVCSWPSWLWKPTVIFFKKNKHTSAVNHKKVWKISVSLVIYLFWWPHHLAVMFLGLFSLGAVWASAPEISRSILDFRVQQTNIMRTIYLEVLIVVIYVRLMSHNPSKMCHCKMI